MNELDNMIPNDILNSEIKSNMSRSESILILPYNTLRFMDASIQAEINSLAEVPNKAIEFDTFLYKLLCRKEKSLGKINNVDEHIIDELIKENYKIYYQYAPRTELYGMLSLMSHQSFVKSITALFPSKEISDDETFLTNEYYDGTYEGLISYLLKSSWTCLIIDDIDLLDKLTLDKRLNFHNKSIVISKIGYNYYEDNNGCMVLKKFDDINSRYFMEISTINLFVFTNETNTSFNI